MAYQLKFDSKKCVGCYACHTACLDAHHGADEIHARSYRGIQKVTDEEKGCTYEICPGCTHCGICAEVCPTGALFREGKYGLILTDKERCIGCKACERVCPNHVVYVDENNKVQKCDGCIDRLEEGREPACAAVCLLDAIWMEKQ